MSVWRNTISTATAINHANVQHTAASVRPRFQSRQAARRTSRSEMTACPGSVTICVTPTPTGWSGACS
ncbi:MAG TPA: hypothetical protein VEP92_07590, partial [Gaiellaceae bacterium]|nr:hypothetical protein [Gaiellaceae bacterium]